MGWNHQLGFTIYGVRVEQMDTAWGGRLFFSPQSQQLAAWRCFFNQEMIYQNKHK